MINNCKLFIDLEGIVYYKLNLFGIDLVEELPAEVVINEKNSLEKAAESISSEINDGTFNYFKWFPNGTLSKSVKTSLDNKDDIISLYGPYLWALLKERIDALEAQQSLVKEEIDTAMACKKSFLGEEN
jgi:hypothetical protein